MSELFPFLPTPNHEEIWPDDKNQPKIHAHKKSHNKYVLLFRQGSNKRKLKLFIIAVLFVAFIHSIPKYFTITKRYGRNSYYLHYRKKYARCKLDPDGPVPAILMALGRSGSSITWDTLSRLAGEGESTVAHEITGGNKEKSIAYFDNIKDHISDRWATLRLCNIQRYYLGKSGGKKNAYSLVGFQWKPYKASFDHHYAIDGLRRIGVDGLRVIFLTRNPLDRYISNLRHSGFIHSQEVPAHCDKDDTACVNRHKEHSKGITINVEDNENAKKFIDSLDQSINLDAYIENRLNSLNVTYIHVTYEKLFDADANGEDEAKEWKKILRFLGLPRDRLKIEDVRSTFHLASTSSKDHKKTIANYEEVKNVVTGTKYEKLLH